MSDFFRELIGVRCDFSTTDENYNDFVLKDVSGEWIVIEDDDESVYLNLRHVISVKISSMEEEKETKKSFFGRKKDD